MMYSPLYDRLTGWLFFFLGLVGIVIGHLGNYAQISQGEGLLLLVLGLLGMFAARSRKRSAVLVALIIGVLCLLWGVLGLSSTSYWLGSTDPFETALRFICSVWGLYVAVQDIIVWRNA